MSKILHLEMFYKAFWILIKYRQIYNKKHCPNITQALEISRYWFTAFESFHILLLHLTFFALLAKAKSVSSTLGRKASRWKSKRHSILGKYSSRTLNFTAFMIDKNAWGLLFGVIKRWQENKFVQPRSIGIFLKMTKCEKTAWYLQVRDGFVCLHF